MAYTLDQMVQDLRAVIAARPAEEAAEELCTIVRRALTDDDFVARHLPDRAEGKHPRAVLYEDPVHGFCVCGHVYRDAAESGPHDHGNSWAIYGQAAGETEMTDWRIVREGSTDAPIEVVPERTYTLTRGDAHFYGVGAVHSPKRAGPTRLIRIEGANLDHVQRSNIAAA